MSIKSSLVLYALIGVAILFTTVSTLQYWNSMMTLDKRQVKGAKTVISPESKKKEIAQKNTKAASLHTSSPVKKTTPTPVPFQVQPKNPQATEPQHEQHVPEDVVFLPTQSSQQPLLFIDPAASPTIHEGNTHDEEATDTISLGRGTDFLDSLPLSVKIGL